MTSTSKEQIESENNAMGNASGSVAGGSKSEERHEALHRAMHELYIHTDSITIDRNVNISEKFEEEVLSTVITKFDEAITRGSGFTLSQINEMRKYISINMIHCKVHHI